MAGWHSSESLRADIKSKAAAPEVALTETADPDVALTEDGAQEPEVQELQAEEAAPTGTAAGTAATTAGTTGVQAADTDYGGPFIPAVQDPSRGTSHLVRVGDTMRTADDIQQLVDQQAQEADRKSLEKVTKVCESMRRQTRGYTVKELQLLKDLCFQNKFDAAH